MAAVCFRCVESVRSIFSVPTDSRTARHALWALTSTQRHLHADTTQKAATSQATAEVQTREQVHEAPLNKHNQDKLHRAYFEVPLYSDNDIYDEVEDFMRTNLIETKVQALATLQTEASIARTMTGFCKMARLDTVS